MHMHRLHRWHPCDIYILRTMYDVLYAVKMHLFYSICFTHIEITNEILRKC